MKLSTTLKKKIVLLKQKKHRDNYGEFVIEGFKIIEEAFAAGREFSFIVIKNFLLNSSKTKEIIEVAERKKIKIFIADNRDFGVLSSLETPSGILAVVKKSGAQINEPSRPVQGENENISFLILDEIRDPGNLGTIIRTADWFGIKNIVLGEGSVDIYNSKVLQSTMGSIFHVNIIENQNLIEFIKDLKLKNYSIIATSLDGKEQLDFEKEKFALIMGNESHGLNQDILNLADLEYKIPGRGKAESLNVAVATGISLFNILNK